ncbi:MAG: Phage capsid family protein [Phycisphaerales bacterium]|nr:Phage capsid family protein [Phycisphaerales bacterium]
MKRNATIPDSPAAAHPDVNGTQTDTETDTALAELIQGAVADGFAALRKELAPARRFTNPADADDSRIPATVKRYSSLKHFTGNDADERAYRFGMFCLGVYGKKQGVEFCHRQGIPLVDGGGDSISTKTSRDNLNTSAGFLVPDEFQNDLIDLRERYGVFRQNARIVPMASDTRSDPRRVNGVTAYFVGESQAPSQSDKTWDRVRLTAKKLMVLTKYSNELNEDAVLNIGDDLAGEIAYAFALKEDQCGFTGDGTSPFGGIVGVAPALKNVDPTPANVAGLVVATGTGYGTSYNSIALADFNKVVATLPEYADVPGETKWYCSKFFWGSVMQRLAVAAGGNRVAEVIDTPHQKSFLGYPVAISQVMPKVSAINQIVCLLANLRLGARLGDRRMTTIQMSEHALNAFEQDEVVIRGTERFDIVVHDVGNNSGTAGPIVGLITGAS